MEDIKYGQLWARHSELVEANQVGAYSISFEGLKNAVGEVLRGKKPGAVWVKASKFKYELEVVYHAKYDDNNKGAGYFNEEYEGANHVFIWQDGADTFQNSFHRLLILDESGTAAEREEDFTEFDADFMRECDLYPTSNGVTIITENDEGASIDIDDINKLAVILKRYAATFKQNRNNEIS